MSQRNIGLHYYGYKKARNKFHILGEILKLQAPKCHLALRASEAQGIVPCGVCADRRCIHVVLQFADMRVSVLHAKTYY